MAELQTEIVGGEPYEYYSLGTHVVRALDVCGGRPTFKYTRTEITWVLQRLGHGETVEKLVADYAGRVSAEAIYEAGMIVTRSFLASLPEPEAELRIAPPLEAGCSAICHPRCYTGGVGSGGACRPARCSFHAGVAPNDD